MEDKIMTQEDKELLMKDLCGRLSYGVKAQYYGLEEECECWDVIDGIYPFDNEVSIGQYGLKIEVIKPYLFPLSSMTEEQYEEFMIISGWDVDIEDIRRGKFSCIGYVGLDCMYDAFDWFNKNHFDYRGLIPMGLANDATGLNIY